jgi:hypothetical protein
MLQVEVPEDPHMSVDVIFVIGLIALSVLVIAVTAVRSRRQQASAASVNAEQPLVSSRSVDGSKP